MQMYTCYQVLWSTSLRWPCVYHLLVRTRSLVQKEPRTSGCLSTVSSVRNASTAGMEGRKEDLRSEVNPPRLRQQSILCVQSSREKIDAH